MKRWQHVGRAALLGALALATSAACASYSVAGDVARVAELSGHRIQAQEPEVPVDTTPHRDVRLLLSQPLTVERAVQIAMLNNRELRATLRQIGVARGRLQQAGLLPNPVLGIEQPAEHETEWELSAEFDVTQALLSPLRADAAQPAVEAARLRAASVVIETAARVRKAFFEARATALQMGLTRDLVDATAAGLDAANALVDSGNAAEIELVQRRTAYQQARALLAQREQRAYAAREALQRLLGLFGTDVEWELDREGQEIPDQLSLPADLETRAVRASLDLRAMRQELEGLVRQANLERTTGWAPDVSFGLTTARPAAEAGGGREDALLWGAGVSVGVPLFDRRQGNIHALEAQFDAEMERMIGRAVDVRSFVRQLRFLVESAHARVQQYRTTLLPAQRELVEQTLLQTNAMQVGVFGLLQVRRAQLDVEIDEVNATRDYLSARADLDALLAGGRIGVADTSDPARTASTEEPGGH